MYLTAEDLRDIIRDGSGIECMTEYTISYARFLLRSWGFTRKVPVGRHVKRASRQKIAWSRKRLGPLIEERVRAGYTACVQDEAICAADARLRKGVYTPKGGSRRLHVHGIALQDYRVRPDHAGRGGVLPEIRLLYREGVCRVPEGRMRKVREDPDDNRRRAAAQVEIRQVGDRAPGRRGAAVSAARLPGSERDRGGVAPDEARGPGRTVRPVQLRVQRHRQVAEVVPAKT